MKTLTRYNRTLQVITPGLFLAIAAMIPLFIPLGTSRWYISLVIVIIGFVWLRKRWAVSFNLRYDNRFLVLCKGHIRRSIPLKDVYSIHDLSETLTILGIHFKKYSLEFKEKDGGLNSLYFYISSDFSDPYVFQHFLNAVHSAREAATPEKS